MDNQIQIFSSEEFGSVRTMIIDGEPWFVLADVCNVLEISHIKDVVKRLDEDEVGQTEVIDRLGRKQRSYIINESGLYNVIIRSDKPLAKPFRKWVTSEVLPTIRKTGSYSIQNKIDSYMIDDPIKRAERWIEEEKERQQLRLKIETDRPKVEFAEQVHDSTNSSSIEEFAKALHDEDIHIGRNKLFKWLRNKRYLMKDNVPYQQYIDRGLFTVVEYTYSARGEIRTGYTTRITGKGQLYFTSKLRDDLKL